MIAQSSKKTKNLANVDFIKNHIRIIAFIILAVFGVLILASFLLLRENTFLISLLCGLALVALGICAFYFGPKNIRHFSSLLLISLGAIVFGGLNGGLFSIGAGAIFWPVFATLAFKTPRKIGFISNLLTFASIILLGFATGSPPSPDNPILPSLFSLVISALVLNAIYSIGSLQIFGRKHLRDLESARQEAKSATTQFKARTSFIAQMSHEIRTPLNHILGFSELMSNEVFGPLNEQYKEYSNLIHQSGRHLSDMVGDLLDMSKIEAGKYKIDFELIELNPLCRETFNLAKGSAHKASQTLNYNGQDGLFINADTRALKQIMLNLMSNSVKYTGENGHIDMRVFGNNEYAWLEVQDTGRGMSAQEIAQIGEPYLNGQSNDGTYRSSGLGLALVKNLCELQNGVFEIWSQKDKGTRVTMRFKRHFILNS
jgi:signal transduction histidine kinase